MKLFQIARMAVCVLGLAGLPVPSSHAATNFNGSTILGINHTDRTVTFRTKEGEKWTLPVENEDLLKNGRVAEGDQVSIELDLNDRITKILKPGEPVESARREAREDAQ
jgi:hypothetical protein